MPRVPDLLTQILRPVVLCAALAAPLALGLSAQAAVLGDVTVRSYLGQRLDADIEITALTAAEQDALLVRIPPADAFAAAGIDMTTLVRTLRVTIDKRGERTFVRVNSEQAVNDPFVMLLVELNAGGTRTLRQYALLIDPAPIDRAQATAIEPPVAEPLSPADPTANAASAANTARAGAGSDASVNAANAATNTATNTAANAANAAAPGASTGNGRPIATTTRRVRNGNTLAAIAREVQPEGVRLEQVLVALQRANPQAFAGNNINRMKSGAVLSVPAADSMRRIDVADARRIIIAQSTDFQRYRAALAARTPVAAAPADNTPAPAAGNRSSSGTVGVTVTEPGARPEPRDQLKLTAPGSTAGSQTSTASTASTASAASAAGRNERSTIDQLAADKALADANARIAALEKNLSRMEQMLEVRDRKLADAQKAAEQAAPSAAAVPGAPATASPAASPATPPVTPPPSATGPAARWSARWSASWSALWSEGLSDPLARMLVVAAVLLGLLAILAGVRARRRAAGTAQRRGKRSKVNLVGSRNMQQDRGDDASHGPVVAAGAAAVSAAVPAASGSARTSGASHATSAANPAGSAGAVPSAGSPGSENPAAPAASSESPKSFRAPAAPAQAGAGEVDAIAEADVYIAYGRDAQAEEILRDALRAQPQRQALRIKLLEIYAARRDREGFAAIAADMHASTGGKGSAWQQAAQMGQLLDPAHPLYGGYGGPQPATSPVDDFGLKLEGLLDEQRREQGRPPAPMKSASASAPAPDFSLSGVGHAEPGRRIEPTLAGAPDQAALTTKLDLALACGEIGDREGARELLSEVVSARDPELSRRAQDMLRKLA